MEKELDYAFVRDDDVPDVQRVVFVRLVRPASAMPAATVTANDAHVDFDAQGNVIGVTLFLAPDERSWIETPDQTH